MFFYAIIFKANSPTLTLVETKECVIIDPVLDYDPIACKVSHSCADKLITFVLKNKLTSRYIFETHAHADHLSSSQYLKEQLGGQASGNYLLICLIISRFVSVRESLRCNRHLPKFSPYHNPNLRPTEVILIFC